MHRRTRALALAVAVAASTSGCAAAPANAGPTVLTVQVSPDATGEAYRALLGDYDEAHRDVRIVVRDLPADEARAAIFADLGRTGLADIVTIDSTWMPDLMRYSDLFATMSKDTLGGDDLRWPEWAVRTVTDAAGRVIAYPAGTAPRTLCYRADLLAAAGLPSDPAGVAALATEWTALLAAGTAYTQATGAAFLDSADTAFLLMLDQLAAPLEKRATGQIVAGSNPAVRTAFDRVTSSPEVFAGLEPGSDAWLAGTTSGSFAASLCAAGTLDAVTTSSDPAVGTGTLAALVASGWEVADAFPGGGATTSLDAFAIPGAGANIALARDLADWLTAPEQQRALYLATGAFPTAIDAIPAPAPVAPDDVEAPLDADAAGEDPAVADGTSGEAPTPSETEAVEQIEDDLDPLATPIVVLLRERAAAIPALRFRGPATPDLEALLLDAIDAVAAGAATATDAWDRTVRAIDALT